ncbi:hypothetical protein DW322_19345 [Rhodococcus rhodnii]|uniref:Uncharacterized protein n=1 Tax=Rhodococcus rhodnii TaxID=38312 RepID=A0A6P2CJD1_9NOCA|nr:hypothetical protein DW322_19345 [Rhodococcus rhodnii]
MGAPAPRRARGGARITGVIAMIVGTVATFVVYVASLTLADPRDLASYQMLALGFVALIVVGAAMFVAATTTEAIRLWSLRRLVESRAQGDRLAAALGERDAASDGQGVGR